MTTNDRFGLVTIDGTDYQIVDIGMRMLQPHELYAAQGFPSGMSSTGIIAVPNMPKINRLPDAAMPFHRRLPRRL